MPTIEPIELTYKVYTQQELDDGDTTDGGTKVVIRLPAKMEVCSECDGTGYVLDGGLRGEAFTMSEFHECFEEPEDREEYFRPGGRYDTQCDVCKGKNVVKVVDEAAFNEEQKKQYEAFCAWEEEYGDSEPGNWRDDPEAQAERRFGC